MSTTSKDLYLESALQQSTVLTKKYSSSFSLSLTLVDKRIRPAIYALYGMVRVADEIVDTQWDNLDTEKELEHFYAELMRGIHARYSSNPIIHSFQWAFHTYGMSQEHVDAFFLSMRLDLTNTRYSQSLYETYIYGSAEVIGLMSLSVFCNGNKKSEESMSSGARALGAAFQKINFLRDIQEDFDVRGRTYFPGISSLPLTHMQIQSIEKDIEADLDKAHSYIVQLPSNVRKGVYLAYLYYRTLFNKMKKGGVEDLKKRQSLSIITKIVLYVRVRCILSL